VIFPEGDIITGTYDALNRLVGISYNGAKKWDISYDANGNITEVIDSATGLTKSFTYDKNNRVIEKVEDTTNKINYGYDDNSNITTLTVTAGTASFNNNFRYNSLDQLIALLREDIVLAEFTYNENGNIASISYPNGAYAVYEYNQANQLKMVKLTKTASSWIPITITMMPTKI